MRFRFVVMAAVWGGAFFFSLDRVNISLAAPQIMRELGISGAQMGLILSLYFWGYLVGNPLGGLVADNLNVRRITTAMLGGWCIFTALTGLCRTIAHFSLIRGLFGLTEGVAVPCFNKLQNNWLLPQERGKCWGIYSGSAQLGLALGLPLVGWLILLYGWRAMFYLSGAFTLLIFVAFWVLVRDRPRDHPWLSAAERDLIERALERDRVTFDPTMAPRKLSFGEAFRLVASQRSLWIACLGFFLGYCLLTANITWLPGYLIKERGYSVMNSGLYLIVPYLMSILGLLTSGYLGDRTGRRTLIGILFWVAACPAMIGVMLVESLPAAIALMGLTLFLAAGPLNSVATLVYDAFPAEAMGTAIGIVSASGGAASGIVAPLVIGYLLDVTGSFFWGFTLFAFSALLAGIVLLPLIPWERQIRAEKARKWSAEREAWSVEPKA